jgi:NAD dependent epimerase/dehydratase family enzyme
VRAIIHLLKNNQLSGAFNLSAPYPVPAGKFYPLLAHFLSKPCWFKVPRRVIELIMGQKGKELVLSSKRVVPRRLLASGFEFLYPELELALFDILKHT